MRDHYASTSHMVRVSDSDMLHQGRLADIFSFQYCIIEFLRAQRLERPSISSECANKSCLPRSVCPVCIASQRAARKLCMVCLALLRTSHQFHCTVSRHAHQLSSNIALKDMRTPGVDPGSQACLDTLGIEPKAFRMQSGCDTTTPCALCILTVWNLRLVLFDQRESNSIGI